MLFINSQDTKILAAKNEFLDKMLFLVLDRIEKISNPVVKNIFEIHINNNLTEILIGDPYEIRKINEFFNPFIEALPDLKESILYVFNYKWFTEKVKTRYNVYNLAKALDISTCVYCNRNYTNTVITKNGKKLIRPQFDHYFDKDSNPLLTISFYNLIPSCAICNSSIKHTRPFDLETHVHPYINNCIDDFHFSYKYTHSSLDNIEITLSSTLGSKISRTLHDMEIREVYNAHTSELKDLLKIRYSYSDKYLNILFNNILHDAKDMTKDELYRLAFSAEIDESKFQNRPFSKFKKDILKELNIIE